MIIEILASLGLTFIIKQGRIFKSIRSFLISKFDIMKDFFDCAMCVGFWCGLLIAIINQFLFFESVEFALMVSFISFITQHILIILEKIFIKHL